jgi:RNA polymerase primary sigma factor
MRKLESIAADAASLQAYLREIAKCPRLSVEQERDLGRRIQQHGDESALKQLVEGNLRFVVSYAKRYRRLGVPFLDLIHEGNLGLIEGARRFDPERNVKFITYAVWWIRQSIMHLLSEESRVYALPPRVSGAAVRFGRQVAALAAQLEHAPSTREIADELEITEADVQMLLQLQADDVSLSDRVGAGVEGSPEVGDMLADTAALPHVEDALLRAAFAGQLSVAFDALEPREREVMRLRYGLGEQEAMTLQQVGDRLRLSRERVRQIETRAMQKLRRFKTLKSYLN